MPVPSGWSISETPESGYENRINQPIFTWFGKARLRTLLSCWPKTRYLAFQEIPIPLRTSLLSEDWPLNPPRMSDMKALPLKC
ncbi:Uncharacterised protein [Vibrio cholerae]|nr:Uncharacterised protein [Vibrio cholerae]